MTKSTSKKITKRGHSIGKVAKGQACLRCYQKKYPCSFAKGDTSNRCVRCHTDGVPCVSNTSRQGNRNDLYELNPTIKSFIKTKQFLKQGSNTHATAWCIVKKVHTSEFNSKDGVMVTADSAFGNEKVPNACSRKVLRNYFGETISGKSGAGKLFH